MDSQTIWSVLSIIQSIEQSINQVTLREKLKIFGFILFIHKFHLQNMAETPEDYRQELDLNNLDLEHLYILEEFKYINNRLKNYTLEINRHPVNLFIFFWAWWKWKTGLHTRNTMYERSSGCRNCSEIGKLERTNCAKWCNRNHYITGGFDLLLIIAQPLEHQMLLLCIKLCSSD